MLANGRDKRGADAVVLLDDFLEDAKKEQEAKQAEAAAKEKEEAQDQ